jgi:iron(III) transport system substrate-binding protein
MNALSRRGLLRIAALGALAQSAPGCARPRVSAAEPAPPTPEPAPPTPETSSAGEWDAAVAAARSEGKLSLITLVNRGWATVIERFERAFPGITVERFAESSAPVWLAALRRGREAAGQSFDLAFVQPAAALGENAWAPIEPLLFHPEVVDDGAWRDGLKARFVDAGGAVCFDWEYQVHHAYAVKTDLVREGEIRSVADLLDPKWRGQVLSSDPRFGDALLSAASVARHHGWDVLKRLLIDQRPAMIPASGWSPGLAESFVRGSYPIARGLRPKPLFDVRARGLAANVAYLDLPDADFAPSTAMLLVDRAPHPAAARLFANWILTREGQTILAGSLPTNSARTDVATFEPDGIGGPGNTYYDPDREANQAHAAETERFVRELLRTHS